LHRREREGLLKVRMYLDLAVSYPSFEDRRKAVLRAIECLDVVLRMDVRHACLEHVELKGF